MDRTDKRKKGRTLRAVWLCAFTLTMLVVLTAPLALSKYAAPGTGKAGARVAKFEPVWGHGSDDLTSLSAGFVNPSGPKSVQMTMTNKSEVAVKCSGFKAKVTDGASLLSEVTSYETGEYVNVGGRVDFGNVTDAGIVTAASVAYSPAEGTGLVPNAGAAQQTFTFTFAGNGGRPQVVCNIRNSTQTIDNNTITHWRTYRVNFEGTAEQVD